MPKASANASNRVVVITALKVEYLAVRQHLESIAERVHPKGTVYEHGLFAATDGTHWDVFLVEAGQGNTAAALEVERAIDHFAPQLVFFVGVAGGIKDVAINDVVVAEKVYFYESGKDNVRSFEPRPEVGNSSYRAVQRARAEAKRDDWLHRVSPNFNKPSVFVGALAAGEKVVASTRSATFKLLRSLYSDALAVEKEGFGLLKAIEANPHIDALIVRGISDLIDGKHLA